MLIHLVAMLVLAQATPPQPPPPTRQTVDPQQPVPQKGGDGAVIGGINAIDANEIESATLAKTKGSAADVRSYASTMLRDHQLSLTAGARISKALGITRLLPADSVMARAQKDLMATLNALTGPAFDKAFMQSMFDGHKAAIARMNQTILPQATRSQVKAFARQALPKWNAHLETARKWLAAHP